MEQELSFGSWLRRRRKAQDWTQAELAKRVGCSAATIRKLEAEERHPSGQTAEKLADIFSVPLKERRKFQKFAKGDSFAGVTEPEEGHPWRELRPSARSNLPWPASSFIGREREIADLSGYLSNPDIRLVTLVGPPGIGKTRLSITAARTVQSNFPDGVFFIPLSQVEDPSIIPGFILKILDYVDTISLPVIQQLSKGIRDKRMLLVIDNCEHVISGTASIISELLAKCSGLKILASSRETLRVTGEWLYPLQPLDLPEETAELDPGKSNRYTALALFGERARAVKPDFVIDSGNIREIKELCARVDGLPLGIELIAARVRWMSPRVLLNRHDDQWILSADGRRTDSDRQKTLQNAISWSYSLLSPEEKQLFSYLSVFADGFTLHAAESLVNDLFDDKIPQTSVTSLVEKSLVQPESDAGTPVALGGEPRFTMLRTIHQYASLCFEQSGEKIAALDWHLRYFLALAEQADQHIHGPEQLVWIDTLEREHKNIRAALNWAIASQQNTLAIRFLSALGWAWLVRNHMSEMEALFEKIKDLPESKSDPVPYAGLLNHLGRNKYIFDDFARARAFLEESQSISLELGTDGERTLAETYLWLGLVFSRVEINYALAKSLLAQGLGLHQKWGNVWGTAQAILHMAIVEMAWDHDEIAESLLTQSHAVFQALGDQLLLSRVYLFFDFLYMKLGEDEKALQYFEQHIAIDNQLQFWYQIAMDTRDRGYFYHQKGAYAQAEGLYEHSLAVCEAHGIDPFETMAYSGLLAFEWKNYAASALRFQRQIEFLWRSKDTANIWFPLAGLASTAGKVNQPERAAVLFGAAQAHSGRPNTQYPAINPSAFEAYRQETRDQLGEDAFTILEGKGRAMSLVQAVEFAAQGFA